MTNVCLPAAKGNPPCTALMDMVHKISIVASKWCRSDGSTQSTMIRRSSGSTTKGRCVMDGILRCLMTLSHDSQCNMCQVVEEAA
jgi:hypothetical protein